MFGTVAANVARIDLHLSDGRNISLEPQDIHDTFDVNFYLVAGPYSNGLGVERVIAYDDAGNQIGEAVTATEGG